MSKQTHFKCMNCQIVLPLDQRANKPWTGWRISKNGSILIQTANFCCPDCGSNDLVVRAPGVDAVAA